MTIIERRRHPEQGFHWGLLDLKRAYLGEHIEAACKWALVHQIFRTSSIANVLKRGFERLTLYQAEEDPPIMHDNIRGAQYYAGPPDNNA